MAAEKRSVDAAMRDEPAQFAAFGERIEAIGPRIDSLQRRVDERVDRRERLIGPRPMPEPDLFRLLREARLERRELREGVVPPLLAQVLQRGSGQRVDMARHRCLVSLVSAGRARPFIVTADWRPTLLTDRADLRSLLAPREERGRHLRFELSYAVVLLVFAVTVVATHHALETVIGVLTGG